MDDTSIFQNLNLEDIRTAVKTKLETLGKEDVHVYFCFERNELMEDRWWELLTIEATWKEEETNEQ